MNSRSWSRSLQRKCYIENSKSLVPMHSSELTWKMPCKAEKCSVLCRVFVLFYRAFLLACVCRSRDSVVLAVWAVWGIERDLKYRSSSLTVNEDGVCASKPTGNVGRMVLAMTKWKEVSPLGEWAWVSEHIHFFSLDIFFWESWKMLYCITLLRMKTQKAELFSKWLPRDGKWRWIQVLV